ncbi:hypothetical protein KKI98_22595, partial [Xenorhabdus bovienii]|nr:hypothetical protein [Xenorhabdus bovienii]
RHFTSTNAITIPHVFTLIIREKQRDEYVTQKRKWKASAKVYGKRIHLGTYANRDEAIQARELFCRENYGEFNPI